MRRVRSGRVACGRDVAAPRVLRPSAAPWTGAAGWARDVRGVLGDSPPPSVMRDSRATRRRAIAMLVRRSTRGDQSALADLCEAFRVPLRAFFARRGVVHEALDDAVQETFARLVRAVRVRTAPERHFGPWLFGIAGHVRVDAFRERCRADRVKRAATDRARVEGETAVIAEWDTDDLASALDALPADLHQVLLLRCEGLSYAEIAARTGLTVGGVTMRLHRARALLRRLLEGRGESVYARAGPPSGRRAMSVRCRRVRPIKATVGGSPWPPSAGGRRPPESRDLLPRRRCRISGRASWPRRRGTANPRGTRRPV